MNTTYIKAFAAVVMCLLSGFASADVVYKYTGKAFSNSPNNFLVVEIRLSNPLPEGISQWNIINEDGFKLLMCYTPGCIPVELVEAEALVSTNQRSDITGWSVSGRLHNTSTKMGTIKAPILGSMDYVGTTDGTVIDKVSGAPGWWQWTRL